MSLNPNRSPQGIQNSTTYQWNIDALEVKIIIISDISIIPCICFYCQLCSEPTQIGINTKQALPLHHPYGEE